MNIVVIPCVHRFLELPLSTGEIGTIIGSDLLYLAVPPSCYKPSECHQERISFQALCHFNVYCMDIKTHENDPKSFLKTLPTVYVKWTKTINADKCNCLLTWGNTIHRKVSNFLLKEWALTLLPTVTLWKNFPDNRTCIYDPKLLTYKTDNVLSSRVTGYRIVIFYYNPACPIDDNR